ncbi:unnamed protein product [Symbiodinium sp. CCMP2456]|nr:unnamed protein product [Symbiodinium sp. CCMP2456]
MADQVPTARRAADDMAEIVSGILGETVVINNIRNARGDLRERLLRSGLEGLGSQPMRSGELSPQLANEMAIFLGDHYREHVRLEGIATDQLSSNALPAAVATLLIDAEKARLEQMTLTDNETAKLQDITRREIALDYLSNSPVASMVAKQRIWIRLLVMRHGKERPQLQGQLGQIVDQLERQDADATNLIQQLRSGELALVKLMAVVLAVLFPLSSALGAVVYLKGKKEPVAGFVESSDDDSIELRIETPEGEPLHRRILRTEIDLLLQPVSPSRLAQLSPENPKAYREYAEELVEKASDPEAVETAARLFMIAAHLDPQKEGRSALLGMTPLMTDAQGVKRLRAMAYLTDPNHDAALLEGNLQATASGTPLDESMRDEVINVLQMLRKGERADARQQLQRDEIQAALQQGTSKITLQDCLALVQGNCPGCEQGKIPPYMMQKLVAADSATMGLLHRSIVPQAAAGVVAR